MAGQRVELRGQAPSMAPLDVFRRSVPGVVHVVAPDQQIATEGERRDTIMGVLSGLVRCFRMTLDGRRHVARFVPPGGLIGLGVLAAFRSSAEAVATSAIIEFRVSALEAAARQNPAVTQARLQALTAELLTRDRIQFRLGRLWAEERVADFLLELAEGARAGAGSPIALQMPRADIADHLGVTIETVSRALSRFHREGLIQLGDAHHLRILHPSALTALAKGDSEEVSRRPGAAPSAPKKPDSMG